MGRFSKEFAVFVPNFPLTAGITTTTCGDFGFSRGAGAYVEKVQNKKLARKTGARAWLKVVPEHDDKISVVKNGLLYSDKHTDFPGEHYHGDGIVFIKDRRNKNKTILISPTADCPTLIFSNGGNSFAGIVHSGRKGTHRNIAGKAVKVIQQMVGVKPGQLHVGLIPGISWQNYEVDQETARNFNGTIKQARFIDLRETIATQLLEAGVPEKSISMLPGFCSFASQQNGKQFYSYRATGSGNRNAAFVCI